MKMLKYNLIKGPKKTVNDYLQTLNNEDLQVVYCSSFLYDLQMPELIRKMKHELHKRNISTQGVLF